VAVVFHADGPPAAASENCGVTTNRRRASSGEVEPTLEKCCFP
jgi:hypothetical protein